MAKKQLVPENIQKQFDKAQYKPGDVVAFTWLGAKKYGYVKTFKTSSWGVQYLVESDDTRYPCGISIKGHKTAYTTGCINFDETRSIGQDEIKRRIQTGYSSTYTELFTDTRRAENESGSKPAIVKSVSSSNNKRSKSTQSNNQTKNVVESSTNANTTRTRKKRTNNKLDAAIQRQRDFLNGFTS